MPDYAKYSGIGFLMLSVILLGTWLGLWLDEQISNPYHIFTLLCLILSVVLALWLVVRKIS